MRVLVWTSADPDCPENRRCMAKVMVPSGNKGALEMLPVVFFGAEPEATREQARASVQADLDSAARKRENYAAGAAKRKAAKGGVEVGVDTAKSSDPPEQIFENDAII